MVHPGGPNLITGALESRELCPAGVRARASKSKGTCSVRRIQCTVTALRIDGQHDED